MTRPGAVVVLDSEQLFPAIFDAVAQARLRELVDLDEHVLTNARPADPGKAESIEIAITGWGAPRLDAVALAAWPNLRAVLHAAGSVKRVVSPALWDRGVRVSSSAAANALPVAEYTLAMILLSAKNVLSAANAYRDTQNFLAARPLGDVGAFGVTVGIVGASRIGRRVLELLRPFDLATVLFDPSLSSAEASALGTRLVELPELLRTSQVVSLHAPSLPETYRMIGREQLGLMADGATLINTARGRLVDTEALVEQLRAGRLRAVLDVTDPEPLPADHPLFSAPGTTLTPHLAGSLGNELHRIGRHVVDELERFLRTGHLEHEVTPRDLASIA